MEHQHIHKRETFGIEQHGIINPGNMYRNLSTPVLYEEVVRRREGFISHLGPVVVCTGQHTGRAAKDKFVAEVLMPENTWQDKAAYREKVKALAANFQKNFKQFENDVSEEVKKIAIQA